MSSVTEKSGFNAQKTEKEGKAMAMNKEIPVGRELDSTEKVCNASDENSSREVTK